MARDHLKLLAHWATTSSKSPIYVGLQYLVFHLVQAKFNKFM